MSIVIYCAGDSWTYGAGLEDRTDSFCNQLANMINADCYNYGVNGTSNSGMFNEIFNRLDEINGSNYDKGYIILTFTENGRDIRDYKNRQFDYISAYKNCKHNYNFYNRVLDDIEHEWQERLDYLKEKLDPRFRVITGCNFAKPSNIKLDITESWCELIGYTGQVPRLTCAENTNTLNEIIGISSSDSHKQWVLDYADQVTNLYDFMNASEYMLKHDTGHPNALGHKIWAERILCDL